MVIFILIARHHLNGPARYADSPVGTCSYRCLNQATMHRLKGMSPHAGTRTRAAGTTMTGSTTIDGGPANDLPPAMVAAGKRSFFFKGF
jgi:hypothetical protein